MRRFGALPLSGIRYTERHGAYAVIRRGDRLLVTEQTRPSVEIQLPGGGIDPGETPVRALHREALEETGWRIVVERRLGVYRRFTWMPEYALWARKTCHVYLCRAATRPGPPGEPGHRALWMDPQAAAAVIASPGDAWFVARAFGLGPAAHGRNQRTAAASGDI